MNNKKKLQLIKKINKLLEEYNNLCSGGDEIILKVNGWKHSNYCSYDSPTEMDLTDLIKDLVLNDEDESGDELT